MKKIHDTKELHFEKMLILYKQFLLWLQNLLLLNIRLSNVRLQKYHVIILNWSSLIRGWHSDSRIKNNRCKKDVILLNKNFVLHF